MLRETSPIKGYVRVICLLPKEMLEVAQCSLWVLDGLKEADVSSVKSWDWALLSLTSQRQMHEGMG